MSRVSGKNKILKKGELLFKAGDSSDGMYVLRKGQIQIFLDKGGNDIVLASVAAGGMIGEMSLFDKKPRSASARAMEETEVTQISNDDFNKIISQIPKWLVSLMATLSSRLRDTNERLQDL
ncbi:MAG: cyclic nucleotide-binding domain-containing protein, partial [Proteobacteria bacterium]